MRRNPCWAPRQNHRRYRTRWERRFGTPMWYRVIRGLWACVCLSGLLTAPVLAKTPSPSTQPWKLWYRSPASNWNSALPLGNGRLGAMVFGGVSSEHLQLNEDSLWDGYLRDTTNPEAKAALPEVRRLLFAGHNAEATESAKRLMGRPERVKSYQPLGDLRFEFPGHDQAVDYRRELDLDRGQVTISYRVGATTYRREYFISAVDQVLVVRLSADGPGTIEGRISLSRSNAATIAHAPYRLVMQGDTDKKGIQFAALLTPLGRPKCLRLQGENLEVSRTRSLTLLLAGATSYVSAYDTSADPLARAETPLTRLSRQSFESLRDRHEKDHRQLFRRVHLNLGGPDDADTPTDERLERVRRGAIDLGLEALYFQYGRYLLIASSRPGDLPANLQGIWNEHMAAPWNSDYHFNINVQMNYWPAEVANLAECHRPFLSYLESLVESGRRTARIHYGARGWVVHHLSDIWEFTTPADGVWGIWPMGAAWASQHFYEHYRFGRDERFLAQRAYPIMKEAARFVLDFLVEAPPDSPAAGRLVTNPSHSPENAFRMPDGTQSMFTYGATMDLQIIHDLLTNCREAIGILGQGRDFDPEFRRELDNALARLAPLQISPKTGRLQEWIEDYEEPEPGHRHMSHLFGLHPGRQISLQRTPELAAAARKSLEYRLAHGGGGTGWSRAWLVNFWARLQDGQESHRHLHHLLARCTLPNLFDTHPPFQIDGNFGGTAGIAEMLLQSHLDVIQPLPALPPAWAIGEFRGLRARGGFVVDVAWSQGTLQRASVHAETDGPCRWQTPGDWIIRAGGRLVPTRRITADTIEFAAKKGTTYALQRRSP